LIAFSEPPSDSTWLENAFTRINPCGAIQGKSLRVIWRDPANRITP
jgi:hypothetical protein